MKARSPLTPEDVAAVLVERGPLPCEALTAALRRRKSNVRRVLGEHPTWFKHEGRRRGSLWSLRDSQRFTDSAAPEVPAETSGPIETDEDAERETLDSLRKRWGCSEAEALELASFAGGLDRVAEYLRACCLKEADHPLDAILDLDALIAEHFENRRRYGVRKLTGASPPAWWGPKRQMVGLVDAA